MMTKIIFAQAPTNPQRFTKSVVAPQTPLVPLINGQRALKSAFRHNAFSLWAADNAPENRSFNFLPPDVPAPRSNKMGATKDVKAVVEPQMPLLPEEEEPQVEFRPAGASTSNTVPRFRSALEQVSYFTNETARKQFE